MAYTEDRFGEVASLGTDYVTCGGPVDASTKWNVLINITNLTTGTVNFRAYIADTSWTSGEPTGGALKVALAYDMPIAAGDVVQISGVILLATEELVVRASVAASLAVSAHGVAIT